ncbi:HAD-IIA family hydrolase [Rubrobacter taiwanensis]|uniref:HAD-IIA family hydrolase n=1 Tax=Rubrobacter taiwanensis TaxID=185139 RepID=UPI001405086E|nr:HAD hydrolase-like protein [Rubrobacter taiwanensis]
MSGDMKLDGIRGFVFDVDGSLVHRDADFRPRPLPGAPEVLEKIRASGRPLVLFTNGTHLRPEEFARGLREGGLPVRDDEVLTPVCSALGYLKRRHDGRRAMVFGSETARRRMAEAGVQLTDGEDAEVVFVTHVNEVDFESLERAARAITRGARLLTASYGPGYWGADGMIFSRGAMVTAALAKATGARPVIVGKPSRAAVRAACERLGVRSQEMAVIGDDLDMDIGLGRLGGSRTILVRSGTSGSVDLARVPERRRPDAVVEGVGEILQWL